MYKLTKNQFNFLISLIANRAEIDVPLEMRRQVYELFYRIGYEKAYSEHDRELLLNIRNEYMLMKLKKQDWDDLPF